MSELRILLAEDEPAVSASVAQQLRALGHQVIAEAATGGEAVLLADKTQPDAIIMDIMMPDCDGIEAARQIAEKRALPVLFLSGHFDEELLEGVASSGGFAYLLKPASTEQLQAALTLAVTRFSELRDLHQQTNRLQKALETRKIINRAKGIIIQRDNLSEQEAHRRLQKEASRSNKKLVDIAQAILTAESLLIGDKPSPKQVSSTFLDKPPNRAARK